MPEVGGKKYDYTDAGIKAAAKAAKRTFPLVSAAIGGGRGASSAAKNMKRRKAKVEQATAAADKRTLDDLEDALTQEHNRGFTPGHSAAGRGSAPGCEGLEHATGGRQGAHGEQGGQEIRGPATCPQPDALSLAGEQVSPDL